MNAYDGKRRRCRSRDPQIIREEVLRPCRYLGYDRDEIGCYLLAREAFDLAESQFRRAAYLNPYEPMFRIHWAVALTHLNHLAEAHDLLVAIFRDRQDNAMVRHMWHHFWPEEPIPVPETAPPDGPHIDSTDEHLGQQVRPHG